MAFVDGDEKKNEETGAGMEGYGTWDNVVFRTNDDDRVGIIDALFYWEPARKILADFELCMMLKGLLGSIASEDEQKRQRERLDGLEFRLGQRLDSLNEYGRTRGIPQFKESWMWDHLISRVHIEAVRTIVNEKFIYERQAAWIPSLVHF